MRITLNSDYELLIDPDKLHLSVDPVALVESLSEIDLEALTRAVAASRPVLALERALSILREADTAEVLHASLDAAEALRRDLAEYADPAAEVWDGAAARPLTPEERKRVMAVVGVPDAQESAASAVSPIPGLDSAELIRIAEESQPTSGKPDICAAVLAGIRWQQERQESDRERADKLEAAIREWIRAGTTAGSSEELRYARAGLRAALSATDKASA